MSPDESALSLRKELDKCADVYFGLRGDQISRNLINACMKEILTSYKSITIPDIQHAFDRAIIEKKDWFGLTKHQLLQPIREWANKRHKISIEFADFHNKELEAAEAEQKMKEFTEQALCIYRESLRQHLENVQVNDVNNEGLESWMGDVFQAQRIAKDYFAHQIDESEKSILWKKAQLEAKKLKAKTETDQSNGLFDASAITVSSIHKERLFSVQVINRSIQMNLQPKLQDNAE